MNYDIKSFTSTSEALYFLKYNLLNDYYEAT